MQPGWRLTEDGATRVGGAESSKWILALEPFFFPLENLTHNLLVRKQMSFKVTIAQGQRLVNAGQSLSVP